MIDGRPGEPEDDDALSWAGEGEDPTLVAGHAAPGRRVVRGGEPVAADDAEPTSDEAAASSALLVAAGVTAGVYLLYTIAWIVTATRQSATTAASFAGDALGGGLYALGLWFAVAAPAVWFAAAVLGTREARVRTRVIWLGVGLVLLAPLPFLRGA